MYRAALIAERVLVRLARVLARAHRYEVYIGPSAAGRRGMRALGSARREMCVLSGVRSISAVTFHVPGGTDCRASSCPIGASARACAPLRGVHMSIRGRQTMRARPGEREARK
jgi:hypothetical protein